MNWINELSWLWETLGIALIAAAVCVACAALICKAAKKKTNKKVLADTIRAVLPAEDCDYFGAPKAEELHSEILYIGFWTDKGNADSATLELLSKLRDKKVFLFGTAGFGGSEAYFQKILEHVKQSVGPSNSVFGEYMCQGKMPQSVRDRYMKMKTQPEHPANIDALIENFDRALSHPDEDDLERLRKIVLDRQ